MDKKQEALGNKVKHLAGYQKEIAVAMTSVADKVSSLDKNVQSVSESSEKITKMLTGEEFTNPDLEMEMAIMRRQLMDLKSKIEINPTLVKMRKKQQVLGQTLDAIDREITINERRLSHITDTNNEWGGRLMEEGENRNVLNDAIQALAKSLKGVRNDVTRLQNPQGSLKVNFASVISPAFKPLRVKRGAEADILKSLYMRNASPRLFSGKRDDIPIRILRSRSGLLVLHGNASLIWRKGVTRETCYRLCEIEQLLDCNYYFFDTLDQRCILMDKNLLGIYLHTEKEEDQTDQTDLIKPLNNDVDTIKKEVENLQTKLETELKFDSSHITRMYDLQNKESNIESTLKVLSDRVRDLDVINPQIVGKINTVDNKVESISGEVETMGNYEHQMANALTNVDRKVVNLDSELTSIRLANDHLSRQLSNDQMANPEYERDITDLKRKLVDLMSRVEANPTVMKVMKNQRILAEALQSVEREIAVFSKRQFQLEENANDWNSRLIAQEEHRRTMSDVLDTISQALKDVRKDVANLLNPLSVENMQRTKQIKEMRSDVEVLDKSNSELEQDVFHLRTDLTKLVKDLVNVQLSSYDSKSSIMALVEANKNIKLDFTREKASQNQMITQIRTLSTVYRSVLAALHSLELKQIQVMHHVSQYENEMRRISSDIGNRENLDKDSVLKAQIKQDMPLILDMRKFQIRLFKQVYELKRELFTVQRKLKARKLVAQQLASKAAEPSEGTFHSDEENLTNKWFKNRMREPSVESNVLPFPEPSVESNDLPLPEPSVESNVLPFPEPSVESNELPFPSGKTDKDRRKWLSWFNMRRLGNGKSQNSKMKSI
ncbi:cytadherence high molecular weight protein 2-like isoform X2 [Gigantopelta aegis]|nr:cytadherence high molecular weight protein 2-like isoform X2 [Gigantopelta aegis]